MENVKCACGAVMNSLGCRKAALSGELTPLPEGGSQVKVALFECPECGATAFSAPATPRKKAAKAGPEAGRCAI